MKRREFIGLISSAAVSHLPFFRLPHVRSRLPTFQNSGRFTRREAKTSRRSLLA